MAGSSLDLYGAVAAGCYVGLSAIFLFFAIWMFLIIIHTDQMRSVANSGDLVRLEGLNSIGWELKVLILGGLILGIMLLVIRSAIIYYLHISLESPNPISWAVIALIFGGAIPSIIFLLVHSAIEEL